jgi:hypothetical protein
VRHSPDPEGVEKQLRSRLRLLASARLWRGQVGAVRDRDLPRQRAEKGMRSDFTGADRRSTFRRRISLVKDELFGSEVNLSGAIPGGKPGTGDNAVGGIVAPSRTVPAGRRGQGRADDRLDPGKGHRNEIGSAQREMLLQRFVFSQCESPFEEHHKGCRHTLQQ